MSSSCRDIFLLHKQQNASRQRGTLLLTRIVFSFFSRRPSCLPWFVCSFVCLFALAGRSSASKSTLTLTTEEVSHGPKTTINIIIIIVSAAAPYYGHHTTGGSGGIPWRWTLHITSNRMLLVSVHGFGGDSLIHAENLEYMLSGRVVLGRDPAPTVEWSVLQYSTVALQ